MVVYGRERINIRFWRIRFLKSERRLDELRRRLRRSRWSVIRFWCKKVSRGEEE